jgi:hypothetical protein
MKLPQPGPGFYEGIERLAEQERCERALLPHLLDQTLLNKCKEAGTSSDDLYLKLLQIELLSRILSHLITDETSKTK